MACFDFFTSRSDGRPRAAGAAGDNAAEPRLADLRSGARGTVLRIVGAPVASVDRLTALGVSRGAAVTVLQTHPAFVFTCDQTELAVEPAVARTIVIEVLP
jgi:Fe2+ transport system protein FeoA